jgi:ADP-ribosylglycohydrolase
MRLAEIKERYGRRGIADLVLTAAGTAEISDDTQMTIFTAEGLLRALARRHSGADCHLPSVVYHAYIRWLHTQGVRCPGKEEVVARLDGWVSTVRALYAPRAPGASCLSALAGGRMGTMDVPVNNSKGCGGVMRVAPVGLVFDMREAFAVGCELAAITHGHPYGYLPAGVLACLISCLIAGMEFEGAVRAAFNRDFGLFFKSIHDDRSLPV